MIEAGMQVWEPSNKFIRVHIDGDRSVCAGWMGGSVRIVIFNGDAQKHIAMTTEAASALFVAVGSLLETEPPR